MKKLISIIMCVVLSLSVICMTGCGDSKTDDTQTSVLQSSAQLFESGSVLGEGKTVFKFAVVDANGEKSEFEIRTDKTIVGDALAELGMIAGDESEYGLYVKTVNGITLDYDKDGKYWAFYVNGEYAMTGVDATEITPDTEYLFMIK
ncbi:MAG: DUF4430 domain-containing protein [Faecalibacterium sp.]|nr:DUF4430 domain-containing protein [Ruminococcus sp.]MCM1391736.1 DUF4430 domain-containing protein [Ruminococcus sp.]MCM1485351.1 DUF4430 domain-containing protein [Faecalibacterium sp.]